MRPNRARAPPTPKQSHEDSDCVYEKDDVPELPRHPKRIYLLEAGLSLSRTALPYFPPEYDEPPIGPEAQEHESPASQKGRRLTPFVGVLVASVVMLVIVGIVVGFV